MKKLLIIGALATAIGASMVSGTLARYSKSWDDTGVVRAAKYDFDVTYGEGENATNGKTLSKTLDTKFIPGQRENYVFTVNDTKSEVDMDLTVDVLVGDNNENAKNDKLINGLKVTLQEKKGESWVTLGDTETHKGKAGRITIKDKLVGDTKNDEKVYRLVMAWDDFNTVEQNDKHVDSGENYDAQTPIRVFVNGTQARHN